MIDLYTFENEQTESMNYKMCDVNGAHICRTCTHGYHLQHELLSNNENGIDGVDDGDNNENSVKSRYCTPNECFCNDGIAKVTPKCGVHNGHQCASCNVGFELRANKCECLTMFRNGTMFGALDLPGVVVDDTFGNRICFSYENICDNGFATGFSTLRGTENCGSCFLGYAKKQVTKQTSGLISTTNVTMPRYQSDSNTIISNSDYWKCEKILYYPRICTNGVATHLYSDTDNHQDCKSCGSDYQLVLRNVEGKSYTHHRVCKQLKVTVRFKDVKDDVGINDVRDSDLGEMEIYSETMYHSPKVKFFFEIGEYGNILDNENPLDMNSPLDQTKLYDCDGECVKEFTVENKYNVFDGTEYFQVGMHFAAFELDFFSQDDYLGEVVIDKNEPFFSERSSTNFHKDYNGKIYGKFDIQLSLE